MRILSSLLSAASYSRSFREVVASKSHHSTLILPKKEFGTVGSAEACLCFFSEEGYRMLVLLPWNAFTTTDHAEG